MPHLFDISMPKTFHLRGASHPDPLASGFTPGPRRGLCPQTPVIGSALAMCTPHTGPSRDLASRKTISQYALDARQLSRSSANFYNQREIKLKRFGGPLLVGGLGPGSRPLPPKSGPASQTINSSWSHLKTHFFRSARDNS